jgi:hypothetical protein
MLDNPTMTAKKTKLDTLLEDLFTNGSNEVADRLVLAIDAPGQTGVIWRNLGGRNRISVRAVILRHFPELDRE